MVGCSPSWYHPLVKKLSIIINAVGIPGGLVAAALMGILGLVFLGSHETSDKVAGVICFASGAVIATMPIVGVVLAVKKTGRLLIVSLVLGIALWILLGGAIAILPAAIGAAAMP